MKDAPSPTNPIAKPAWTPSPAEAAQTHIGQMLHERGLTDFSQLYRWSADNRPAFWADMIERLGIIFHTPPSQIEAMVDGTPRWLPGAMLNIADSCFRAPASSAAIVYADDTGKRETVTIAQLEALCARVANGLQTLGLSPGDAVAIDMPMTIECVAAYLGVIRAGCVAISIADSFAAPEIATRLRIGRARLIFTQDVIDRAGKRLPLYERVVAANAPRAIVTSCGEACQAELRDGDLLWDSFLSENAAFTSIARPASAHANILFSSGTTGDPKAIPWSHTTPIKCAADAYLHHDIKPGDVLAWPTNLGWMMGPWLVFATLINRATIALFGGVPTCREFGQFVQDERVTMLGVVPTLVSAWRSTGCMEGLDWSALRCFSSTGECSSPADMHWLMTRQQPTPVIEYCGGTEIGGAYITSTLVQPNEPSTFTTPAMGLDLVLLDENGKPADEGEVYLVGSSIGLSTELLNADHDRVYLDATPSDNTGRPLRRHGDQLRRLPGGRYQALGRADDTMNLGGIKISAAELERAVLGAEGVQEVAAIAVPPTNGGPDRLILFVVAPPGGVSDVAEIRKAAQSRISAQLNPLFRVYDVVVLDRLPRTASNKVMRRQLRSQYASSASAER